MNTTLISSPLGNPPTFALLREQIELLRSEVELLRLQMENLAEDNAKVVRQMKEWRKQNRQPEKVRPNRPR